MIGKLIVMSTIVAAGLLAAIFHTQNPTEVGPLGLLVVFLLLYVIALSIVTWIVWASSRIAAYVSRLSKVKRPSEPLSVLHSYYYGSVIALGLIMLLAMKSIGSTGVYDVVLVTTFVIVGLFYISRRIIR